MEKVDWIFIALLIFGIISLVKVEFPNITGNTVSECFDSDDGVKPFVGGNLVGFDESVKRDFCVDGDTLYEYYCLGAGSSGEFKQMECEFGCVEDGGKGKCLEDGGITRGDITVGTCDSGCYFKGVCLPIGSRTKDGTFCDGDEKLEIQTLDNGLCFNSYECRSNLCIADKCVSKDVFNRFLASI